MLNQILDYFLGNKIKIVTARCGRSYIEYEQHFLFHNGINNDKIKTFLWEEKHYSVRKIKTMRSKKIESPQENCWRSLTKEKRMKFVD